MKKVLLSLFVCLMAMSVAFAQTADKKKNYKKDGKYETVEITMDKVPAAVKASLKAEGIADADVKKAWKVKKEDGKIYKFKAMKDGEKMKYKYKADGTLVKKEKWSDSGVSS